jgi:transposase
MERLSASKKQTIIKLYLSGFSYDEIAAKCGVSKGTVANVVTELKAGKFPEATDAAEHIDQLRELSQDLRRSRLTPGQCATGLILLTRINECGLDAADVERWPMILKSIGNEDEAQEFVRLVYSIQEVQKRTGLSPEALDNKVHELEGKATDLEPMAKKREDYKKQVAELTKHRGELASEVASLKQEKLNLEATVKEDREKVSREIIKIVPVATDTINRIGEELRRGHDEVLADVRRLKDETLEVGKEVGRYEGILEVNQWLNELLALVKGEENLEGKRVRVIVLLILRGAAAWLKHNEAGTLRFSTLQLTLENLTREIEQWKV